MKNIANFFFLCALLHGWTHVASAHTIHMKDGSTIHADSVWEETLGYFLDDVSLYACKKAGMPEHLVKRLGSLQYQLVRSKERLLQLIQQQIGAKALARYQTVLDKYLAKKEVVSYEKFGDTIHLGREKVKRVEYNSPPPSIGPGFIDPQDKETRRAIEAEKAMLYERLRKIREQKSAYVPEDTAPLMLHPEVDYKEAMRTTQQQIKELERNPIGYFLHYYPELVNFNGTPSSSDCYTFCDGASVSADPPDDEQEAPLIRAASDEKLQRYKECMNSCQNGGAKKSRIPEQHPTTR